MPMYTPPSLPRTPSNMHYTLPLPTELMHCSMLPPLNVTKLPSVANLERHLSPLTPPDDVQMSPPSTNHTRLPPIQQCVDWLDAPRTSSSQFFAEKTCEMICYLWFSPPKSSPSSSDASAAYPSPTHSPTSQPQLFNQPSSSWSLRLLPTPAFVQFLQKLLETTQVSQSVIVLSLHYIWRLKERSSFAAAQAGSEFRIAVAGLMMANKFLDDNTYTNKTWSDVSAIPLDEINRMELEFLGAVDFNLYVDEKTYESWTRMLKGLVGNKERALREWRGLASGSGVGLHRGRRLHAMATPSRAFGAPAAARSYSAVTGSALRARARSTSPTPPPASLLPPTPTHIYGPASSSSNPANRQSNPYPTPPYSSIAAPSSSSHSSLPQNAEDDDNEPGSKRHLLAPPSPVHVSKKMKRWSTPSGLHSSSLQLQIPDLRAHSGAQTLAVPSPMEGVGFGFDMMSLGSNAGASGSGRSEGGSGGFVGTTPTSSTSGNGSTSSSPSFYSVPQSQPVDRRLSDHPPVPQHSHVHRPSYGHLHTSSFSSSTGGLGAPSLGSGSRSASSSPSSYHLAPPPPLGPAQYTSSAHGSVNPSASSTPTRQVHVGGSANVLMKSHRVNEGTLSRGNIPKNLYFYTLSCSPTSPAQAVSGGQPSAVTPASSHLHSSSHTHSSSDSPYRHGDDNFIHYSYSSSSRPASPTSTYLHAAPGRKKGRLHYQPTASSVSSITHGLGQYVPVHPTITAPQHQGNSVVSHLDGWRTMDVDSGLGMDLGLAQDRHASVRSASSTYQQSHQPSSRDDRKRQLEEYRLPPLQTYATPSSGTPLSSAVSSHLYQHSPLPHSGSSSPHYHHYTPQQHEPRRQRPRQGSFANNGPPGVSGGVSVLPPPLPPLPADPMVEWQDRPEHLRRSSMALTSSSSTFSNSVQTTDHGLRYYRY